MVTEGELRAARAAGIPASAIVFSGVGKTEREMRLALAEDIAQINMEIAEEAGDALGPGHSLGRVARVALRVNPDVDARTHAKIATGRSENKFGVAIDDGTRALCPRTPRCRGRAGRRRHPYRQPDHRGMAAYRAAYARARRTGRRRCGPPACR